MCTNAALVDSLECYIDDLVDCFEDFIKKSLIIISVAIGALVLMLVYVLKVITERASNNTGNVANSRIQSSILPPNNTTSNSDLEDNNLQNIKSNTDSMKTNIELYSKDSCKVTKASTSHRNIVPSVPSTDERVLRNIGLSNCSKSCTPSKRSITRNTCSATRLTVPSLPTCLSQHPSSSTRPRAKNVCDRGSCCSLCCDDNNR